MNNHLIIGLGGTGGRVLAAYRKLIFEKFHGNLKPKDIWIDYVYVESSGVDLKMDDPAQWTVMGQTVKLDNDSVVEVKAANLADYVNNKNRYKYLAPWLGEKDDWSNIINDPKISFGAAGQKRRLGRLLFANGADNFNKVVGKKVQQLQNNPSTQNVVFHLVCGLAGGTGSGSIIDAVAQLRNTYPDTSNFTIMLYLLLPDEIPNPSWASTANYQPNGYAALTELNALDYQLFQPWNVGEREYDVERLQLTLPFYSAYLVTEQNNQNVKFDVQKVVPASMAEFIFQKTVGVSDVKMTEETGVSGLTESPDEFFHRAESGENPKYEDYGCPHSFKFMTYGIKRLAIPELEIKEYFGYSFSAQAINQMIYNNLSRESGYLAERLSGDDYSIVTDKSKKVGWFLHQDYLCLNKPILDEHKKENWRSITDEYNVVDEFRMQMMSNPAIKHNDKLQAVHNCTKQFFEKKFRPIREEGQNGVKNFYENKMKHGLEAITNQIIGVIEADFLKMWRDGDKSLMQLTEMVSALILSLTEEKEKMDDLRAANISKVKEMDKNLSILQGQWGDLGLVTKSLFKNKMDSIANDYTKTVKDKFICMTWEYSSLFAKELISQIITRLITVKSNIDKANEQFIKASELIAAECLTRCKDEDEEQQGRMGLVIKNYDPDKARAICSGAILQSDNDQRVKEVRSEIMNMLSSDKKNFREVADKLKTGNILAIAETCGLELAEKFFDFGKGESVISGYERLIGVNIIKKLQDEFNGNPVGLKAKLSRLVKHAAVMAKRHPSEVNDGPTIKESMFVILPDYKEDEDFLKEVIQTIQSLSTQGSCKVSTGGNPNEIVVINLESNLTPRYLKSVEVLKNSYNRLMSSAQGKIAKFETQLEDYDNLPSLYKPTDEEIEEQRKEMQRKAIPNLLMARSMDILQTYEEPETGLNKLAIISLDEYGGIDYDQIVVLGKDLEKSVEKLDEQACTLLDNKVQESLRKNFRHVERQADLKKAMGEEVRQITVSHNNSISDPVVRAFNEAFKAARQIIDEINE